MIHPGISTDVTSPRFDVDLPLEVDDEYWEDEKHPFQQPGHKPSRIEFFNVMMRLNHILGFSLKILVRFIFHLASQYRNTKA
jgi:hypothetical protein